LHLINIMTGRLKILHFTNAYPNDFNKQLGAFVKVMIDGLEKKVDSNLIFINPKYEKFSYLKGLIRIRKFLNSNKVDIIHTQFANCAIIARIASPKSKIIYHMHGELTDFKFNSLRKKSLYYLARIASILSDAVITVNSDCNNYISNKTIVTIPIGVDQIVFYPRDKHECLKELNWDDKKRLLFTSYRTRPEKNYSLFNKVSKLLNEKFSFKHELVFLEDIPHNKIPIILNAVDVLLFTSLNEASPTIIKEANFCNLPIVSVNVGDVYNQLKGVDNCFISSYDPYDLAQKVMDAFNNERSNGYIKKVDTYSIDATIKNILILYNSLV
jgi:teichuronic acid biosynthesis glycosyltransferase TuaC